MQDFPHHYTVSAHSAPGEHIALRGDGLEPLTSEAPAQFGGPGDLWSPEDLLVAAIADCFILTFRAISRASKFDWQALSCSATGKLDRIERVTRFTDIELQVKLTLPAGADSEKALKLLEKSEANCLITNSMNCEVHLHTDIVIA
jgi:peroxiredoxin-like protein